MMMEPTRELTPEERKRGERLLRRSDALHHAYWVVEEGGIPNAETKAEILKHLQEMGAEASAEVQSFRREHGIPGPGERSSQMSETDHKALVWTLMHECFDALEDEQREHFTADLERRLYPGELETELRVAAHLVEGLCVAAEGVNFVTLLVASDCRERVRRALRYAEGGEE